MTTAVAVKSALFDALTDQLEGIHVGRSLPPELPQAYERVYISRSLNHRRVSQDGALRVETYDVQIVIEVDNGQTPDDAEERAREIEDLIEAIVEDDIGPLGAYDRVFVPGDDELYPQPNGWLSRLTPTVEIEGFV